MLAVGSALLYFFAVFFSCSECARILTLFPVPSTSHYVLGNKLAKELVRRGHEVTMVSPYAQDPPMQNYTDIVLDGLQTKMQKHRLNNEILYKNGKGFVVTHILGTAELATMSVVAILEQPSFQNLLKSEAKFDLIIMELFLDEALFGLAYKYNCPIVGTGTIGASYYTNHLVGNPSPCSYLPEAFTDYSYRMDLYERFSNTLTCLIIAAYQNYVRLPGQEVIMKQYFPDAPDLQEIIYNNLSMILLNSHPSISGAKPHVPTMVEIGGYHVEEPRPLPFDLQEFLDNAKNGAILFSMGSVLTSADFSSTKKNAIMKSFMKLNQSVLWKLEDENLTIISSNVKVLKWLPQNDILAHPNLKVFITHGGLLSVTEAVYHGVAIVGIPIFADQRMNIATAVTEGYGVRLDYDDITEETVSAALEQILNNKQYEENVKMRSKILRDQYMKPLNAAMFWIDYVLRHKGAKHLRSPAMDLHWTQLYLLDIIALIVLTIVTLLVIMFLLIKRHYCAKMCNKTVKQKTQ